MTKILKINQEDNVATTVEAIERNSTIKVDDTQITTKSRIPRFHKIAIADIPEGELIYKYGEVIGRATKKIEVGEHVHVHNIESTRGRGDKGVEK